MYYVRGPDRVQILSHFPQGARWAATVRFTGSEGGECTVVDMRPLTKRFQPSPLSIQYSIPILKSNLQKCVRRAERARALRTAWQLLRQDTTELLRRIPVIIPEDTMIQPALYTELVWLMAAYSKGYQLSWADAALIMDAVATAIAAPAQYAIDVASSVKYDQSDPLQMALTVRIAYGGMEYDHAFLTRLRGRLFVQDDLPLQRDIVHIEEDIEDFDPERDILLEAIDQHCFPSILKDIAGLNPRAMWWCRSAVSVRPYVGTGAEDAAALDERMIAEFQPILEPFLDRIDAYSNRKIRRGILRPHQQKPTPVIPSPACSQTLLDSWIKRKT
jgi:hypothetical protein